MLKWIALILVGTVLCWGDTNPHSNTELSREKNGHPVVDEQSKEVKSFDALNTEDKIELENLLQRLEDLESSKDKTGEKDEQPKGNLSNNR